jgi:hypothetical protein
MRFVGVYDADGDLRGELAYLWGKTRGLRHCGLCDITHGPLRRKREWDRFVAGLAVEVDLLHLDERAPEVTAAMAGHSAPVVLAVDEAGRFEVVIEAAELSSYGGSVARLGERLTEILERSGAAAPEL